MKYIIILCFILTGCINNQRPLPKIGECFESYWKDDRIESYEYRKVIGINPKDKYKEIEYVYNFPNDSKFKKGVWYTTKYLNKTSRFWFYTPTDRTITNKIECPW